MIPVNLNELEHLADPEFRRLLDRARKATHRLMDELSHGQRPRFDAEVWKAFKPYLARLFHGKCAYCESNVAVVAHGDIENFRPKRLYPYLAYELTNLLYTCAICNQRYKKDQFPLEGKSAPWSPEGVDDLDFACYISEEKPLLLNPYFDEPQAHLAFTSDEDTGGVTALGLSNVAGRPLRSSD